ncbi:MAG: class I SAM-dependent methyltransferase [Planctomycetota bacterium]
MRRLLPTLVIALAGCLSARPTEPAAPQTSTPAAQAVPVNDADLQRAAERMIRAAEKTLAPVYAPLAEQIVADLDLADARGIGIDLGSGPGTLIVELCPRTRMHWVNADINPYFFPYFYRLAEARGVGHRVSAVYANATRLPFRDGWADVVVSRGSYHFWPDREAGFAEIYRVLKPGGVAYVGRGFPANLPVETARAVRAKQGRRWGYEPKEQAQSLRTLLAGLGIRDVRVHLPAPPGSADVNYGLWVEFHKPREPSP